MPPLDTSPESQIRYLTRLLAALVTQNHGELRVKRKLLRKLEDENMRQALFEDLDDRKDEIVLRFGSKHSAVYPLESECRTNPSANAAGRANIPSPSPRPVPAPTNTEKTGTFQPMTDEQIARAEHRLRQIKLAKAIRSEGTPR